MNVDMSMFNSVVTIVANRKAPADRTRLVQEAFSKASNDPDFRNAAKAQGVHSVSFNEETLQRRIEAARKLSIPLMKEMNLLAK